MKSKKKEIPKEYLSYSKSEIAYMMKRDEAGYQTMSESDRWAYDKRHGMLDF